MKKPRPDRIRSRFAASLLAGIALSSPATAAQQPAQAAASCPASHASPEVLESWKSRVEAAQALTDSIAKRDALLALVREALGPDTRVELARNSSPTRPDTADYAPFPVVNFDINLADKRDSGTAYFFSAGDKAYVILGPSAVHTRGPVTTQHNAQHEVYHARYHVGDARPMLDREVEVWADIFIKTFHDVYPHKLLWNPLMSSYENASPAERQITLHKLVNYYNNPPVDQITKACLEEFRTEFAGWAGRRIADEKTVWKRLVRDLHDELNLPTPPPAVKE